MKFRLFITLILNLSSFIFLSCSDKPVLTGLDQIDEFKHLFTGKRVGLIANHTAVDSHGQTILQRFQQLPGIKVTALFGPEHGFLGQAAAGDTIGHHQIKNIPVYSLYGATTKPTPVMLANVDILVYDIQDVGTRYYTYISTMGLAMEAAADLHIPFVVLDRPNPIGGKLVQGAWLDSSRASFVGKYPVPVRHGLTSGELAQMISGEGWLGENRRLNLTIIAAKNWKREMLYDESGLKFIPPSPNMPSLETALLYPGTCLFEGTNLSEGRGTTKPFALIGAPWLDSEKILEETGHMNGLTLSDTSFIPHDLPGKASHPKWENRLCNGIYVNITNRHEADPFLLAIRLLEVIQKIHPDSLEWRPAHFDRLAGSPLWREAISRRQATDSLWQKAEAEIHHFYDWRKKYLLY